MNFYPKVFLKPMRGIYRFAKDNVSLIHFILIIILGFSVYLSSLNGKFIWDDEVLIKDNVYIKSLPNIRNIFTKDLGAGAGKEYHFYRPIQTITYMIDYSIWKLNVKGYHLTNILLHIMAALIIYCLINTLYKDNTVSFFTSILFAAHPIHTEAVSYIASRADLLAAVFMLLCLIFYIKYLNLDGISKYLVVTLCYVFAILSKEHALILPLLLLICHYAFKLKFKIKQFLPILAISFTYIFLRVIVFNFLMAPKIPSSPSLYERLPGVFVAIANYTKLLFLPFNLHMEYGYRLFSPFSLETIVGFMISASLLFLAYRQRNNRLIFFPIAWFFIGLLPILNIYPINAYMAEHWLYLPSIGFFLVFAVSLSKMYNTGNLRMFASLLLTCVLIFYSFLTIRQNNYWKDPILFYERTLKYSPNNPRLLNNLGRIYQNLNKDREAIILYKMAIANNKYFVEAYNNLGTVYNTIGQFEEAISLYKKSIQMNPNYAEAYNNLGNVYQKIGKLEDAISSFKKAIEIYPDYTDAHNNIGNAYKEINLQTVLRN